MSKRYVLILNKDYTPLNVVSWKRGVVMFLKGKGEMILGIGIIPEILRLFNYVPYYRYNLLPSRKNLMIRDSARCQYCGSVKDLTIDHVIPKCRGGLPSWDNLVVACQHCNSKKGNKLLSETGMKLLNIPKKPNLVQFCVSKYEQYDKWCNFMWQNYGIRI